MRCASWLRAILSFFFFFFFCFSPHTSVKIRFRYRKKSLNSFRRFVFTVCATTSASHRLRWLRSFISALPSIPCRFIWSTLGYYFFFVFSLSLVSYFILLKWYIFGASLQRPRSWPRFEIYERRQRNCRSVRYHVCLTFSNENSFGEIIFGLWNRVCGMLQWAIVIVNEWIVEFRTQTPSHILNCRLRKLSKQTHSRCHVLSESAHRTCHAHRWRSGIFIPFSSREQAQSKNQNVVDVYRVLLSFIRSIWNIFFSFAVFFHWPLFI